MKVDKDKIKKFFGMNGNQLDKSHYDEREERYLNIIRKYPKEEQNVFPTLAAITVMALEDNPEQDFLGALFMELKLSNDGAKQIFTPYHMSELMAELTLDNVSSLIKKQGFITINDCCCGGGSTLIAAVNSVRKLLDNESRNFQNHVLVIAQDIDETVALMCYIQISLLGVAGYVKVGNALSEPMSPDDTIENYWFTPMYFSDVWVYRRVFRKIDEMTKGENKDGV